MYDYPSRVGRLQAAMEERGIDVVLLSVGADLPYFTGYEAMASERPTIAAIGRSGSPVLFIPRLEAPRVDTSELDLLAWDELDDPIALIADRFRGVGTAAIGDHTWSVFLVRLIAAMPGCVWSSATDLTRVLRSVKDDSELNALARAADAVDRVLARVPDEVRFEGATELEVSRSLAAMTLEEGHRVAAFSIVASGPNGASPHHEPGERVIERGDLVICDFGGSLDSYFSDVTRTFSVGEPDGEKSNIHATVLAANEAGRAAVAPGVRCEDVDAAARRVIDEAGYGDAFIHRTGHGIGLEVHEHPYLVAGNSERLQQGMTFSVEPGIYLAQRMGVRIEDIVACGPGGAVELNSASRDLVVVT